MSRRQRNAPDRRVPTGEEVPAPYLVLGGLAVAYLSHIGRRTSHDKHHGGKPDDASTAQSWTYGVVVARLGRPHVPRR